MMDKKELLTILELSSIISDDHKLWYGPLNSHGYGQITYQGRKLLIHRISAYIFLNLDINNFNIQANHKLECKFKNCWNYNHLYLGTQTQNMKDLAQSGNAAKNNTMNNKLNHCHKGHEYTSMNTRYDIYGYKRCRICERKRRRNNIG